MKKVSLIITMLVFVTGSLMAQSRVSNGKAVARNFHVKVFDGRNSVRVPDDNGTITFEKRGDKFTDVVYTDAAGKVNRLSPVKPGTGNLPKPACEFPIPDACYSIPNNQSIGMCICRPTDISSGEYNISLLLPAVQAARESARRSSTNN